MDKKNFNEKSSSTPRDFPALSYDTATNEARKKADDFYDQLRDMTSEKFEECINGMLRVSLEEVRQADQTFKIVLPKPKTPSPAEIAQGIAQNLKAAKERLKVYEQSFESVVTVACMLSKTRHETDPLYSTAAITAVALYDETKKLKQLVSFYKNNPKGGPGIKKPGLTPK